MSNQTPSSQRSHVLLGVSLKLYLDLRATESWASSIASIVRSSDLVASGKIRVVVLPSFLAIQQTREAFRGTPVEVGAQDLHWEDRGAFTGATSGADLRELGCTVAEIGHAERIRFFAEDAASIRGKVSAAQRNGLTPLICVGEETAGAIEVAAAECMSQLDSALDEIVADDPLPECIVAYEPVWAIGKTAPADIARVNAVTGELRAAFQNDPRIRDIRVIYGGSAGAGLLSDLDGHVDGLFLGRYAHDPEDFRSILHEAERLV